MTAAVDPRTAPRRSGRLLVADVGNSRIKLAQVEAVGTGPLPRVGRRLTLDARGFETNELHHWLATVAPEAGLLLVGSVHDAAATRLEAALPAPAATGRAPIRVRRVTHADLPLAVALPEPGRVGIDRLAAAAAAATLRPRGAGVVVVDCGTAATIDLVDAEGRFLGGAILPGPVLQARALGQGTSLLPEVESLWDGPPPTMPGRHTREAIAAGIGWGIRGAVHELVAQARSALAAAGAAAPAPVVVTGGWGHAVLPALPDAVAEPDLVLAGIAMAAGRAGGD